MKPFLKRTSFLWIIPLALTSTAQGTVKPKLQEEIVTYRGDSPTMIGFVVFDRAVYKKRPVVLVVPEWWGLTIQK